MRGGKLKRPLYDSKGIVSSGIWDHSEALGRLNM